MSINAIVTGKLFADECLLTVYRARRKGQARAGDDQPARAGQMQEVA